MKLSHSSSFIVGADEFFHNRQTCWNMGRVAANAFSGNSMTAVQVLQEALIRNRQETLSFIKKRQKYDGEVTADQWCVHRSAIIDRIKQKFLHLDKNNLDQICAEINKLTPESFFSEAEKILEKLPNISQKTIRTLLRRTISRKSIEPTVRTKIQLVPNFRSGYSPDGPPPNEHVFIFDEAQRAWSAEKVKKDEHRQDQKSEPDILLSYLDLHKDWCVAVALVGTGQDIHDGEAGIDEWYKTLSHDFEEWDVHIAAEPNSKDFKYIKEKRQGKIHISPELYLDHPMRSFRAKDVSAFVEAVLRGKDGIEEAKHSLKELNKVGPDGRVRFPVYITRDLQVAKNKVHCMAKGSERYGILISSKAKRLRHYGLFTLGQDFNQIAWFLDKKNSIESSFSMEIAASEFKIQGLEIDYTLVGWDGDFKYDPTTGKFLCRKFSIPTGEWTPISGNNADTEIRHLINAYRVILTRARQGMVIFVPRGDISCKDKTVLPAEYDDTYNFLKSIGITEI